MYTYTVNDYLLKQFAPSITASQLCNLQGDPHYKSLSVARGLDTSNSGAFFHQYV